MSIAVAYALKKRKGGKPMNQGGMCEEPDIVERAMQKRKYSEGGMVANDVGVAEADKLPAEYDDLVLRDDLEFSYDAKNSGDELGSDLNQDDIVSRALKRRKK